MSDDGKYSLEKPDELARALPWGDEKACKKMIMSASMGDFKRGVSSAASRGQAVAQALSAAGMCSPAKRLSPSQAREFEAGGYKRNPLTNRPINPSGWIAAALRHSPRRSERLAVKAAAKRKSSPARRSTRKSAGKRKPSVRRKRLSGGSRTKSRSPRRRSSRLSKRRRSSRLSKHRSSRLSKRRLSRSKSRSPRRRSGRTGRKVSRKLKLIGVKRVNLRKSRRRSTRRSKSGGRK